ncbi:MAG: PPC domain-containing protein [Gemmatimonadaceae bacterium]|nr:PPC domain-containing protein [Gemmatimonadaceae bacterium]MCW5826834.1 PPC domain-containing protein [Gemmatimonadaceae bacterium]
MRSTRSIATLALLASALGTPLALAAQDSWSAPVNRDRMIRVGDSKTAALAASDPTLDDGSHYHLWYIEGRQGETAIITLRSSNFDAYLAVGRHGGDQLESNDDGAGGSDARIRITWPSNGTYVIRANSFAEAETGEYTLAVASPAQGQGMSVADVLAQPVNAQRRLSVGRTVTAALAADDQTLEDGAHVQAWYLDLTAGQRVTVTQRSEDFDSFLRIGLLGGDDALDSNDDYNDDDLDSRISFTAERAGTYVILVSSFEGGETGEYSLEVSADGSGGGSAAEVLGGGATASGDARATRDIAFGQTVSGTLQEGDRVLEDDGTFYDAYTFEGRAGERIIITMRSSDFDAYLSLRTADGALIESNDDIPGADTTDAQIAFTLERAGRYSIYANSLSEGETGRYTLTLERAG